MKDYLKYLPVIALIITFVATTAVSQYQIGVLVDGDVNQQTTLSDIVVNQATMEVRLKHLEDK